MGKGILKISAATIFVWFIIAYVYPETYITMIVAVKESSWKIFKGSSTSLMILMKELFIKMVKEM